MYKPRPANTQSGVEPIIPVWKKLDRETGEWIFGLRPEDLLIVEAGFACHRCLERFHEDGLPTRLDVCPVCRAEQPWAKLSGFAIVPTPDGW